ncbi:MAG: hypothetical protein JW742_02080 [Candidatus Aminicenantes bacterium]|nr:hypothetical protein [Candidatus Aminicenantes bacterium]
MRSARAPEKIALVGLTLLLVAAGAFSGQAEQTAAEQGPAVKEGLNTFEGLVKTALGKYIYIPAAQGFDIIVSGQVNTAALIGKEVKGEGTFDPKHPTLLTAETIEVKEGGSYKPFYTRKVAPDLKDYMDAQTRDSYEAVKELAANKPDGWEGKANIKVFGRLVQGEAAYISLADDGGKETGRILVDTISEFSQYQIKKLRLFDKFWFYLSPKETVESRTRLRTKELFRADIVNVGLF